VALSTFVVGGFAVIYHSQPRFTKDLDLWIKADLDNANATYAALADFGVPLQDIQPKDFTDLPAIPGVDFDSARERRVEDSG